MSAGIAVDGSTTVPRSTPSSTASASSCAYVPGPASAANAATASSASSTIWRPKRDRSRSTAVSSASLVPKCR